MLRILIVLGLLMWSPIAATAQENKVSIVALVLTANDYSPSSDNILSTLGLLKAQTLRADSPNASELRSVLKRFSAAALDNDIAVVFYDGPVLKLDGREFLVPADLNLRRGSDLLTQAIPLSALARATALANKGGAIFVHSSNFGTNLPDGITSAQAAPDFQPGTSPILFGQSGSAMAMAAIFDEQAQGDSLELGDLLRELTARVEFTASYIPQNAIYVSQAETALPVTQETTGPATDDATDADPVTADDSGSESAAEETTDSNDTAEEGMSLPQIQPAETNEQATDVTDDTSTQSDDIKPLSIEMLQALQSGLSRAEKRTIQHGLRDFGFYSGLIDGIFGNQTKFAIEAYQESISADITGVLSISQLNTFIN